MSPALSEPTKLRSWGRCDTSPFEVPPSIASCTRRRASSSRRVKGSEDSDEDEEVWVAGWAGRLESRPVWGVLVVLWGASPRVRPGRSWFCGGRFPCGFCGPFVRRLRIGPATKVRISSRVMMSSMLTAYFSSGSVAPAMLPRIFVSLWMFWRL